MDKKMIAFIALIVIILVAIGGFILQNNEFNPPDTTEFTDLFDYSSKPVTNWDENSHEFKFHQTIKSMENKEFKNLKIDVIFYKNDKIIGTESNDVNETENGTFDLDFTKKLNSEPDKFYYNVTDVNWA